LAKANQRAHLMPETVFRGRAAWRIENNDLQVTVFQSGGHLAEIVRKHGERVSPLWVQSRDTIDSNTFDPEIHGATYGDNSQSRLLSGLAGHNLCFPFWGNPSPAEFAAGMTFHGETNIRRWQVLEERSAELTVEVTAPESAAKMTRRLRVQGHALHCHAEATNTSTWDRPFGWCEHVTIGPPFLDHNDVRFDASVTKGFVTGAPLGPQLEWPRGLNQYSETPDFDLSRYSALAHKDLVNSFMAERLRDWAFFTVFQRRLGLLFGYVYPRVDFPWLNVWESNTETMQTRGMEFSNTPHHGTMKTLISAPEIWGVPAYEWLDARSTVHKRFIAFLHPVPRDYCGTADIRVEPDALRIIERESGRLLNVPI
jgi:hypothetical protein